MLLAFGRPGTPGVDLLCHYNRTDKDGCIEFHVINGAWIGWWDARDQTITVAKYKTVHPATLLWSSESAPPDAPDPHDYNAFIAWLEAGSCVSP